MLKRAVIYLLSFFSPLLSNAQVVKTSWQIQNQSNILYYVNVDSQNGANFLIPYIETELKKLTRPNNDTNLFDQVSNLNVLNSIVSVRSNMIGLIRYLNNNFYAFTENKNMSESDQKLLDIINKNDYFLRININSFNTLIEYQFLLFKISDNIKTDTITLPDINYKEYRATSIFVDPSNPNYKERILNAIKQVIYESNAPPTPYLIIDNKRSENDFYLFENKEHSFKIAVEDMDSDIRDLQITVSRLMILDSNYLVVDSQLLFNNIQEFKEVKTNLPEGWYSISISVNDGYTEIIKKYYLSSISTQSPYLYFYLNKEWDWFSNKNTIHLYSFHNNYSATDFFGSILGRYRKMKDKELEKYLDPNIICYAPTGEEKKIKVSQLIKTVKNDTVSNLIQIKRHHKELFSSPEYILNIDSIVNAEDNSLYNTHYLRLSHGKLANSTKSILQIPRTDYFVVTSNNLLELSSMFSIKYHKMRRVGLVIDEIAHLQLANTDNYSFNTVKLGLGLNYLINKESSISATTGISSLVHKGDAYFDSQTTYLDQSLYISLALDIFLLRYPNGNFINFIAKYSTIQKWSITPKHFSIRSDYLGFGLAHGTMFQGDANFMQFGSSMQVQVIWYPTNLKNGILEIGLISKLLFEKKSH